MEDHFLSAVCDCLFNIFAVTLHIGGHSSIHNLRLRHAMVTGTHLSWLTWQVEDTDKVVSGLNRHHSFMMHATQKPIFKTFLKLAYNGRTW